MLSAGRMLSAGDGTGDAERRSSFRREGAKLEMEPEMLSAGRMCRIVGEDERLRERPK